MIYTSSITINFSLTACCVLSILLVTVRTGSITGTKHTWYIDGNHGNDSVKCGYSSAPCQSVVHAWSLLVKEISYGNFSSGPVEFLLKPGFYEKHFAQPLFLACEAVGITKLSMKAVNR